MTKYDGGPVYPTLDSNYEISYSSTGMTLRDYFAAQAMQGEIAAQSIDSGYYDNFAILASSAYMIADAMIEARNK